MKEQDIIKEIEQLKQDFLNSTYAIKKDILNNIYIKWSDVNTIKIIREKYKCFPSKLLKQMDIMQMKEFILSFLDNETILKLLRIDEYQGYKTKFKLKNAYNLFNCGAIGTLEYQDLINEIIGDKHKSLIIEYGLYQDNYKEFKQSDLKTLRNYVNDLNISFLYGDCEEIEELLNMIKDILFIGGRYEGLSKNEEVETYTQEYKRIMKESKQ